MRQLATIQEIADVQPIEGADAIEKVRVKDWWCVAKKGEFEKGDTCVYFEIDSLLPTSNPAFGFLEKGNKPKTIIIDGKMFTAYRLKTVKLRGQISQGLALPESIASDEKSGDYPLQIGDDVSELLGIYKYEPPIPAQLQGKIKGQRPSYIPKTDEERVQNLGDLIQKYQGTHFFITEKLDGSSATFFRHTTTADGDHFGVCSRNLELLETEGNTFWEVAKKYDLANKIPNGFAVQGELVGEGIQGNPLKIKGHDCYIFNVYSIVEGRFLNKDEFVAFMYHLDMKTVPLIDPDFEMRGDVQALLDIADGKSLLNSQSDREGIVFRPHKEMRDVINGTESRLSFKAVSNKYLLDGHD